MSLEGVKNILMVLSGKGGVGKSSVTVQLALTLSRHGKRVGVLDIDLTGPNIPRMFNIEDKKVHQAPGGWIPVRVGPEPSGGQPGEKREDKRISCMSLAFLLNSRGDSVVWRGPKKTAMVKQFLTDVYWGELDYLLIDTPPGTSDEHITLATHLLSLPSPTTHTRTTGAVLVTTPQKISTTDVRKELNFCLKTRLKILGVIENMSGFICPHCSTCTNVFSSGGGEEMAREFGVAFLGAVPIDVGFVGLIEGQSKEAEEGAVGGGGGLVERYAGSGLSGVFEGIVGKILEGVEG